jgi:Bacterial transglutaminase-like cysteine proteinase BTLCP
VGLSGTVSSAAGADHTDRRASLSQTATDEIVPWQSTDYRWIKIQSAGDAKVWNQVAWARRGVPRPKAAGKCPAIQHLAHRILGTLKAIALRGTRSGVAIRDRVANGDMIIRGNDRSSP